jgi:hypothetical protein
MRTTWLCILLLMLALPSPAESRARSHKEHHRRTRSRVVHTLYLGPWHTVPYSPDPDAATPTHSHLRVRALVVNGRIADWTAGPVHLVTETTYTIRQALRIDNSLPGARHQHWIWQLGVWLYVNRTKRHVSVLHLPGFDPRVSQVVWFRDLAAYCGIRGGEKPQLTALLARISVRKALLAAKITPWNPAQHRALLTTPACAPPTWQLNPLRVSFQPSTGQPITYRLDDGTPILMQQPSPTASTSSIPIP